MAKRVSQQEAAKRAGQKPLVVRYLRVSRLGDRSLEDEAFHSPHVQLAAIDAQLDRSFPDGWDPVPVEGNFAEDGTLGVWADLDVSGRTRAKDRAGLSAAMAVVEDHSAAALAVYNLSRWARSVSAGLQAIADLQEASGAELISAQESIDMLSPNGRFSLQLFLSIAELYAEQSGEQWRNVIERRANNGLHHGRAPVGYRQEVDPVTGKAFGPLLVDTAAAAHVVAAFTEFSDGASKTAVGSMLRDAGVISSSSQAVAVLSNRNFVKLHAEACVGTSCDRTDPHGDHAEISSWELEELGQKTTKRRTQIWHPAVHVGIVDADLFAKVQNRLTLRAESPNGSRVRRPSSKHELVGVVRCAHCGRALSLDMSKTPPVFKDSSGMQIGCHGPGAVSASRMLVVVRAALSELWAEVSTDDDIDTHPGPLQSVADADAVDVGALYTKRQRAVDDIADVEVALRLDEYDGGQAVGTAVVKRLRKRVDEIEAKIEAATDAAPPQEVAVNVVQPLVEGWDDLTVEERNDGLRKTVTVYVARRSPDAPFRQPYEERCSVFWNWVRT